MVILDNMKSSTSFDQNDNNKSEMINQEVEELLIIEERKTFLWIFEGSSYF